MAFPLFTDYRYCEDAHMKKSNYYESFKKILAIQPILIMETMKTKQKKVGHFQHHPLLDICFMLDLQV